MSLKDDLNNALKEAMRANDAIRKNTLRLALSAIKLAEVEKQEDLDDAAVTAILQKEVKSRKETQVDAEKAGRQDMIAEAADEIKVLEEYLPEAMSEEDLIALVKATIEEVGASSPADMGKVMGALMPKVQGRADGGQLSALVRQQLQGS
ncbi:MAG: GatB/YqeY domain-containing protein [Chloroflexi bacterium]|nr:MAG: GatB/YqeY domain-containing protein [Chloroflexota bacterium]MBL1197237.1 GatB/YqeY domain-containing protein [Chloroflexota bacterium]NOH14530.1 GatB/YqeY domain-containing protein [Chloroflexota bacterium]